MRIVRVTSFYGPVSSTQSTVIRELGMGYLRAGHEFVVISPGATYSRTVTSAGTVMRVPYDVNRVDDDAPAETTTNSWPARV